MNQQPVLSHGAPIHGSQNVPVQPPEPLIGRDADIDAINVALKAGTAVLLHGTAGIGKTAIVAALAAGYAELPGGVLWIDVASDTLRSLVTRVTRAYGLVVPAFEADIDDACVAVRDVLLENRPLVVLDGVTAIADVRDFVRECTSGVPLLITHPSMAPGPWTPHEVKALEREDASTLLLHHAAGTLAEDAPELQQLLDVLGGHPLSIEVSARQLATGTAADDLLAKLPDLPPGQKNRAMAVLMAAYRLLPSELQAMVMLLGAAFAGGASEELLSDVSGARSEVLHTRMTNLVAHGFATDRQIYGEPYYAVHDLVREFAQAFLRGKKRLNTMLARYLQALPVYVRRHVDELDLEHYDRLSTEMPNILGAGAYAAKNEKLDALRELLQPLSPTRDEGFVALRRFGSELTWLEHLLDHPDDANAGLLGVLPPQADTLDVDVLDEDLPSVTPGTRSTPDAGEAIPPVEGGAAVVTPAAPVADLPDEASAEDVPPVEPDVEPAVTELPADDVPADEALPEDVDMVADASAETDVTPDEREQDEPAAVGAAALPDESVETTASDDAVSDEAAARVMLPGDVESLEQIGLQSIEVDDSQSTIVQYQTALEGYQADGNVQDELAAIEALAKLHLNTERYDDVLAYLDQGMTLAQEADNPQREGEMLGILGDLQQDLGMLDGAEMAYREAISALRPVEAWLNIGLTLEKLGRVYMKQRRVDDAVGMWQQALPIFENEGRNDLLRQVLNLLGDVNMRQMNWSQSEAYYLRALETAKTLADDRPQFVQLSKLAHLMETSGRRSQAVTYYRRALHFALKLSEPEQLGRTELALARLLIDDTMQLNRALQLLQTANDLLPDDKEAQRLLNRVQKRQERLQRTDVALPAADDSLDAYAQAAFEAPALPGESDL